MSFLNLDRMLLSKGHLLAGQTVNVDSTMSEQQIQSRINSFSRTSGVVFIQFADGTYNLVGPLVFNGLGDLTYIAGNTTEGSTRHTNQAVHFNFSSGAGVLCVNSYAYPTSFRVSFDSTAAGSYGVKFVNCQYSLINSCYVAGNGATNGSCIRWEKSCGYGYMTVFANSYYGMHAHECSYVYENNCGTTTPAVNTAIYAEKASQLSMVSSAAIVNYTTMRLAANAGNFFYVS